MCFYFFFQAEDGIRDYKVTGVQTCALPIFPEMAQTNSDDANAANGGEMPQFEKGQLRKEIEDAIWSQPKGFVTDPIKIAQPAGFYIFKVEEHQKAGLAEFEEVQTEVENALFRPKMEPAMRDYLTK